MHSNSVTLQQLVRVYKRGERVVEFIYMPAKTTAHWAMARVNLFLKLAADQKVPSDYSPQDRDIANASDRSHEQEMAQPFYSFTEGDFIGARCDLLLAHITDSEGDSVFQPPPVEEA